MKQLPALCALSLIMHTSFAQTSYQQLIPKLDAYVQDVLKRIDIPAVGVVIVKDGKPFFIKAYGYADREANIKADNNTLFYIASATKSFTALAAALLDSEGKIKLGMPMSTYMGDLKFRNNIPAQKITIRRLLTHTSGLRNEALVSRMAYFGISDESAINSVFTNGTTFSDSMYSMYRYDNLGYNIYGILLQAHLQQNWKELLAERIFKPLKMDHTTCYMSEVEAKKWTVAMPYRVTGAEGATPTGVPKQDDNQQSAGGIFSSLNDLATWMMVNIDKGKLNGQQIFPQEIIELCQTGYASVERDIFPFMGASKYGLGWVIGDYNNQQVVYHFGGWPGYQSHLSLMPGKRLGVAVLTNEGVTGQRAAGVFAAYVYDWFTKKEGRDTVFARHKNELIQRFEASKASREKRKEEVKNRVSKLSLENEAYAGKYYNEVMGTMEIFIRNNTLYAKLGNLESESSFYNSNESIEVDLIPGSNTSITFNKASGDFIDKLFFGGYEFVKR